MLFKRKKKVAEPQPLRVHHTVYPEGYLPPEAPVVAHVERFNMIMDNANKVLKQNCKKCV